MEGMWQPKLQHRSRLANPAEEGLWLLYPVYYEGVPGQTTERVMVYQLSHPTRPQAPLTTWLNTSWAVLEEVPRAGFPHPSGPVEELL